MEEMRDSVKPLADGRAVEIEGLGVEDRYGLLKMARWLLSDWPRRFVGLCRKAALWSSDLLRDMDWVPYWYWDVVHGNLYLPSYQPSDAEVASVIEHLRRGGSQPRESDIARLLDVRQVFRKRKMGLHTAIRNRPKSSP